MDACLPSCARNAFVHLGNEGCLPQGLEGPLWSICHGHAHHLLVAGHISAHEVPAIYDGIGVQGPAVRIAAPHCLRVWPVDVCAVPCNPALLASSQGSSTALLVVQACLATQRLCCALHPCRSEPLYWTSRQLPGALTAAGTRCPNPYTAGAEPVCTTAPLSSTSGLPTPGADEAQSLQQPCTSTVQQHQPSQQHLWLPARHMAPRWSPPRLT